jgi:hypothetical protein
MGRWRAGMQTLKGCMGVEQHALEQHQSTKCVSHFAFGIPPPFTGEVSAKLTEGALQSFGIRKRFSLFAAKSPLRPLCGHFPRKRGKKEAASSSILYQLSIL